ncbi:hypothetical protein ABH999_006605 [Bradyrhizobium yuanmingense]
MTGMTQTEYAAHRGVSRQAISKLVKAGKIPASAFVDGKIDPAAADFALGETRERIMAADVEEGDDELAGGADPTFGSAAGTRSVASDSSVARLTQAKTATEIYRARTAELEYDQRVGKLLVTEDVTRSMEKCAAVIVRELEALPNFADDVAAALAKDGLPGARVALKNIARNIRLALELNMRVVAADDEAGKGGVTS